jgi:hypothetical protein
VSDAPAIRPPPLGWPWDALLDAGMRLERADAALLAAGTAGDVMGKLAAALDREKAIGDFFTVREEMARQWMAGLRAAVERYGPTAIAELLDGLPPAETVKEAIGELEDRVDAVENSIARSIANRWRSE